MTISRPTNSTAFQPTEGPGSDLVLAASVELGSEVNQRFGLNLPEEGLVLVTPDIPGLIDDAAYCPYDASDVLAEVQQLLIANSTVSVALIFDMHVRLTSEYFAQNLRSGLPLVLVSADGQAARIVRLRVIDDYADSVDDAARYFAEKHTFLPQAMLYLLSLHDLSSDLAALLAGNRAAHGQRQNVHIRCVLGGEHLTVLGGTPFETFLALGHRAPRVGDFLRAD